LKDILNIEKTMLKRIQIHIMIWLWMPFMLDEIQICKRWEMI